MKVEMEVSLYPLAEEVIEHPVHDFVDVLRKHGCDVELCPMSEVVKGESEDVFEALRLGYEDAAGKGGFVLFVKACNACPL
jgi:uncharacterized protein YqgV (UPF0045/DUF77 family)